MLNLVALPLCSVALGLQIAHADVGGCVVFTILVVGNFFAVATQLNK